VRIGGRETSPLSIDLSADQGSPLWLANLEIAEAAEYAALRIGDPIEITIGDDTWALTVDEKLRNRPTGYRIKALSPVAAYGAPWAAPRALGEVGFARAVCETLLAQPIDWSLPDWLLPASAASIEATPLELVRRIVAAVGGVLESAPDGHLIARPTSAVSPPTTRVEGVTLLTDEDMYGHGESVGSPLIADRFTISSGEAASTADVQVEVIDEEDDPHVRTVLVYPWPWRELALAHTGDGAVEIGPRGERVREESELLEIAEGRARTRYPVHETLATTYRYVDLGAARLDGYVAQTEDPEYSQLEVQYRTRAQVWRVAHPRVETIQFLAMEP
jgi:hypothetical protein